MLVVFFMERITIRTVPSLCLPDFPHFLQIEESSFSDAEFVFIRETLVVVTYMCVCVCIHTYIHLCLYC